MEFFHLEGERPVGIVLWLTGLSGAGKTTLAREAEQELLRHGVPVCVLDGDEVRKGLCSDLGFSPQDRSENIRRVAEVAKTMADAGLVVIVSLISPFQADRQRARDIIEEKGHRFLEVFVDAPLEVCQKRDPKKLYRKVQAGELKQFTGIDSPYEPPIAPELILCTDRQSVKQSTGILLAALENCGLEAV